MRVSTIPLNSTPSLHIVLHQPEIPQNTGNVSRTCVAIGAKLWLVKPLGFDLTEKRVRRAGLDYWPHLNCEVVEQWEEVPERIPGFRPWFFTKRATRLYTAVAYQPGDTLVFGSEGNGLPPSLLERYADCTVRMPISPHVRSLNLSNAVAIAAYEALRQCDFPGL